MRKVRKPKDRRKPRQRAIRFSVAQDKLLSGVSISPDGNQIRLHGEGGKTITPASVSVAALYGRPAKAKILTMVSGGSNQMLLDANLALAKFPSIFAVDTNTDKAVSSIVSLSTIVQLKNLNQDAEGWSGMLQRLSAFEFHDAKLPAERLGWQEAITRIMSSSEIAKPVAVIVDCDLGKMTELNSRREAIVPGFYLPQSFELVYGSADAGNTEYIANKAIAECDSGAKMIRRQLRGKGFPYEFVETEGAWWSRYRYLPVGPNGDWI